MLSGFINFCQADVVLICQADTFVIFRDGLDDFPVEDFQFDGQVPIGCLDLSELPLGFVAADRLDAQSQRGRLAQDQFGQGGFIPAIRR